MNSALLVIDLQNGFLKNYPCYPPLDQTLEYINGAIDVYKSKGKPVILIKDLDAKGENWEAPFDLINGLILNEADCHLIEKSYSNSFWKTELEELLKKSDVKFPVITGFAAEYCIYATYNGAMERGFHPLILKNGIISHKNHYAEMIEGAANTISVFTLSQLL